MGYKKHKIYLYKEDFGNFKEILDEITSYVVVERGEEVISERHQRNFDAATADTNSSNETVRSTTESFTDVDFDDI